MNNSKQKQPSRCVLEEKYSENMQQIYRRTPMWKCDSIKLLCNFIEITLQHGCSHANLRHVFRATFTRNTSGELRLSKLTKLWWLLVEMWYHLAVLRNLVPFIQFKMWEAPIEECYFKSSCRLKDSNFIKSNTSPWVFFSFFKLCKCTTHHPLSFGLELIQLDQYHLNQL